MHRAHNIATVLRYGEIGGKTPRCIPKFSRKLIDKWDGRFHGIPSLLAKTDQHCFDPKLTKEHLTEISHLISSNSYDVMQLFVTLGGGHLLVRLLYCPFALSIDSEPSRKEISQLQRMCLILLRDLSFMVLDLSHALLSVEFIPVAPFVEDLSCSDEFALFLFELLSCPSLPGLPKQKPVDCNASNSPTFYPAATLAEEVFSVRDRNFDLTQVGNLADLVKSQTPAQLSVFVRLLSLIIFDADDKILPDSTLKSLDLLAWNQRKQKSTSERSIIHKNHQIFLQIPELLERITALLTVPRNLQQRLDETPITLTTASLLSFALSQDDIPSFPSAGQTLILDFADLASTLQQSFTRYSLELEPVIGGPDQLQPHISLSQHSTVVPSLPSEPATTTTAPLYASDPYMPSGIGYGSLPLSASLALNEIEVLFLLCTLMSGKCKTQVQDRVAELNLIQYLTDTFDKIDWNRPHDMGSQRIHGSGCECNSECAFKIQLLRTILNFCDRESDNDENKRLLLSEEELRIIDEWDTDSGYNQLSSSFSRLTVQDGCRDHSHFQERIQNVESPGLVSKLIAVLIDMSGECSYRYWIASCIEAFLRGSSSKYQQFAAYRGLLKHLVQDLLENADGLKCSGNLQTSFDLLGELLKFNHELILMFDGMLTDHEFETLVRLLVSRLVDSNVFLRSLLLSSYQFDMISSFQGAVVRTNKISYFLEKNHLRLLSDLMSCVTLDEITQDNICCLNTTIIFFILAKRNQQIASVLRTLQKSRSHRQMAILDNFRSLLWFWRQYYRQFSRDFRGLEHSSRIQFDEWTSTCDLLWNELNEGCMCDRKSRNVGDVPRCP